MKARSWILSLECYKTLFANIRKQNDNGKEKLQRKKNERLRMSSLVRSHDLLKTYSSSPLVLGDYKIDVCLL